MSAPRKLNLMFSHFGLSVMDLPKMETFYTDFMGFTVTDRGGVAGLDVVFLSRDPLDHHQIVLALSPMSPPVQSTSIDLSSSPPSKLRAACATSSYESMSGDRGS